MSKDGTAIPAQAHPIWCDPAHCTISESNPFGAHQSSSAVIPADPPVETVVELHLSSTMRGIAPQTVLMLDLDLDEDLDPDKVSRFGYVAEATDAPTPYPMTLRQARNLHEALGKLLASLDRSLTSKVEAKAGATL